MCGKQPPPPAYAAAAAAAAAVAAAAAAAAATQARVEAGAAPRQQRSGRRSCPSVQSVPAPKAAAAAPQSAKKRARRMESQGTEQNRIGFRVLVQGDGWGSGTGEYLATVTEADELTYTVIFQAATNTWEETHVLRENCIIQPSTKRKTA